MALKMVDLPEHKDMVKNILYIWHSASPEEMEEGMMWYPNALAECDKIAYNFGLDTRTVVALVSVISPSIMWGGCVSAPEKIIELWQRDIPVDDWTGFNIYPVNLHKAARILDGDLSALKGLKVNAFYANILGSVDAVTIDRWAIRVALDTPKLPMDKIVPSGKTVYKALSNAYDDAAMMLSTDTPSVQAVTWTVYRNRYNGKVRKAKATAMQEGRVVLV